MKDTDIPWRRRSTVSSSLTAATKTLLMTSWRRRVKRNYQHHSVTCDVRVGRILSSFPLSVTFKRTSCHYHQTHCIGPHLPLMVRDLFNFQSHKSLLRSSILTFVILGPFRLGTRAAPAPEHMATSRRYFIGPTKVIPGKL